MPELPEVETIRRGLEPVIVGVRCTRAKVYERKLRFLVPPSLSKATAEQVIVGIRRRSKYLLFDFSSGQTVLVHLGMTGKLLVKPGTAKRESHDRVEWVLHDKRRLIYNDVRKFGWIDVFSTAHEATHPRLVNLGPEPLTREFNVKLMVTRGAGRVVSIKQFLMNAQHVVGIGNIYASETLFAAGVHPAREAGSLNSDEWQRVVRSAKKILKSAIRSGGTTLRDYRDATGQQGQFGRRLAVYGRAGEPCVECGVAVEKLVQGARSTFFCPGCQR